MEPIEIQLNPSPSVDCTILEKEPINVSTPDIPLVDVTIVDTTDTINVEAKDCIIVSAFYTDYNGEYDIIPSTDKEHILRTTDKVLHDDITVEKVPRFDVSNIHGGETVYIGEVIE